MKTILAIVCLMVEPLISAEEILIPSGRIEIVISHDDKPFLVAGQSLKSGEDAASLITFICSNWKLADRPVLVVNQRTKASMPGEDVLMAALKKLSENLNIRIIHMPPPQGSIPHQWDEAARLTKSWQDTRDVERSDTNKAQQSGTDQPATAPESKSEGKDKPQPEKQARPQ